MALSSALPVFPLGIETGPGLVPSRQGANLRLDLERTALRTGGFGNDYRVDTGGQVKAVRGGLELLIEADRSNTGPAFLVVDRFTRFPLLDAGGAPHVAGRIVQGRFYSVLFSDADQAFRLQAGASTLDEIPGLIDLREEVADRTAAATAAASAAAAKAVETASDRVDVANKAAQVDAQYQQVAGAVSQIGGFDSRLTAEGARARAAEQTARTLAAPKFKLPNYPFALVSNGAQFFNGLTSVGATDTSGGIRIPSGQTGRNSQIRARFFLSPADIAARAGRPTRFVATFRASIDVLNALKDDLGNPTLVYVGDGSANPITMRGYMTALDTLCIEGDVVLTGAETQINLIALIASTTAPVAADVTLTLLSTEWFVADPSGSTDVLDTRLAPLPLAVGEVVSATTNFYLALASGAVAAYQGRGFLIQAGNSGKGTVLATEIPMRGLDIGTAVRARLRFQTSSDIDATSIIYIYGATVDYLDGTQGVTGLITLTKLSPGIYEAVVEYTATFGAKQMTFYLGVAEGSVAVPTAKVVVLRQVRLEVAATPATTTISAQVQRYVEAVRSQIQHRPTYRDSYSVAPDGTGDFARVRDAVTAARFTASFDEPNTVFVRGGDAQACTPTLSIKPENFVNISGVGPASANKLLGLFPANQAGQELIQILDLRTSGEFNDLWFEGENIRYPAHLESGNSRERARQIFRRCTFIHRGAAAWANPTALGVGHHAGNRQHFLSCTALSPTSAYGCHDNVNWNEPASVLFEGGSLAATNAEGTCIAATSMGSGQLSEIRARGVTLGGHIRLDTIYTIPGVTRENHRANRYGYGVSLEGCSPVDWISVCDVSALVLSSIAGPASAVAISGAGGQVLFGTPDVRRGAVDFAARAISEGAMDVLPGEPDPGVSMDLRLGDRRGAPLTLGILFDGSLSYALSLDADYRGMTNTQVLANLNSKLSVAMGGDTGGRAFALAKPYQNRALVLQPDREGNGLNVDTATIRKGHALTWEGKNVRRRTGADTLDRFAGIALDDAIPGASVRFQFSGWINDQHLLFTSLPASVEGDVFGVGATPGVLTKGADRGILRVRQVAARGLVFEILGSTCADPSVITAALASPVNVTLSESYESFLTADFTATGRTLSADADLALLQTGGGNVQIMARLKLVDVAAGTDVVVGAQRSETAISGVVMKRGSIRLKATNLTRGRAYRLVLQVWRGQTTGTTAIQDQAIQATCV